MNRYITLLRNFLNQNDSNFKLEGFLFAFCSTNANFSVSLRILIPEKPNYPTQHFPPNLKAGCVFLSVFWGSAFIFVLVKVTENAWNPIIKFVFYFCPEVIFFKGQDEKWRRMEERKNY